MVAPNTTIFEKLKKDLSDNNSAKYVFKGLGCFSTLPQIITDDDYREKTLSLFESDVHIFVYNIDKFNKEGANMKKVNELIGDRSIRRCPTYRTLCSLWMSRTITGQKRVRRH